MERSKPLNTDIKPRMDHAAYKPFGRVLLLFSGGLDSSFLLKYFTQEIGARVVTVSFDVGGERKEFDSIEQRARALGAEKHLVIDARQEFATDYCFKAVKANALFQAAHPLSSSLSRPLMAKLAVGLAKRERCEAIMHGSNGWQNNSARFDNAIRALSDLEILEPIMENKVSRKDEYTYLSENGVSISKVEDNLLSTDDNLWGREVEDGILEEPDTQLAEDAYRVTTAPERAPDEAEIIEVEFKRGVPTCLNGMTLEPVVLVERLNQIGGRHGVGRHDAFEDKTIGYKMREIHESPAATILIRAHQDLENTTLPSATLGVKNFIDTQWTQIVCNGLWHHPLRDQLDAFINSASERVNGTVRLKLYKGSLHVIGRKTPNGLYLKNLGVNGLSFQRSAHPGRNYYDYNSLETRIAVRTRPRQDE